MRNRFAAVMTVVAIATSAYAQTPASSGYLLPPKVIVDILDAPPPPTVELSPARDVIALLERASMPTIAELSQPMLPARRASASTRGPTARIARQLSRAITLKSIADGSERKVTLPPNPMLSWIGFSPDGKRFAFTQQRDNGIELWIGDTATGQAKVDHARAAQRGAWHAVRMGRRRRLAAVRVRIAQPRRGAADAGVPTGPNIQEHRGGTAPVRTYQDLLGSAHDEALFDYYATSQLAFVDADERPAHRRRPPAVFVTAAPSPDGQFVLIAPRAASVLVAGAVPEFPGERRGVGSPGRAGEADRGAAGGRHRAERRRAARTAQLPMAAARCRRRSCGPKRSTTATRRPRCRIATR